VADVIAAVGFSWASAVVMVSAIVVGVPSAVVLTADDVPGAPVVAKVSAVATISTAFDCRFATAVSRRF
jgi:hypothetical protein